MLISHSHKFLFFHVGKTAGLSMRESLKKYAEEPDRFKIRRPPQRINGYPNPMYDVWETLLLHTKARDAKNELSPEIFDHYFKFAFVRNPWDWLVSLYHFILREPTASVYQKVKSLGSFEAFVGWVIHCPNPFPKGISKFQYEMITDEQGKFLVDFVGKFERLDQDFRFIAEKCNFPASLQHLNKSHHLDYRSYYSEETKNLIRSYYKPDIELFGYSF